MSSRNTYENGRVLSVHLLKFNGGLQVDVNKVGKHIVLWKGYK